MLKVSDGCTNFPKIILYIFDCLSVVLCSLFSSTELFLSPYMDDYGSFIINPEIS